MNIAICDDDKGVCSQLEGWIEQYNYENATRLYVDVYHSAETLQQQLQNGQWYDMLFLDIELPQKNGIELGADDSQCMENGFDLFGFYLRKIKLLYGFI